MSGVCSTCGGPGQFCASRGSSGRAPTPFVKFCCLMGVAATPPAEPAPPAGRKTTLIFFSCTCDFSTDSHCGSAWSVSAREPSDARITRSDSRSFAHY